MSPYLRAAAVYDREPCARSFEEDLYLHLTHGGTVLGTPRGFAMVRPVWSHWPVAWLRDPARVDAGGDTWWVWLLAGEAADLWNLLPQKKLVAFERVNTPRFYDYERMRRFYLSRADAASRKGRAAAAP